MSYLLLEMSHTPFWFYLYCVASIAFLSFGLEQPETLTMTTGVLLGSFGALGVGLYLKYPDLFDTPQAHQ